MLGKEESYSFRLVLSVRMKNSAIQVGKQTGDQLIPTMNDLAIFLKASVLLSKLFNFNPALALVFDWLVKMGKSWVILRAFAGAHFIKCL